MKPLPLALRADLARARSGDLLAFGRLVGATQAMVTALALAVVRDRRASELVALEVYAAAWRELAEAPHAGAFLVALRQRARRFAAELVGAPMAVDGAPTSSAGSSLVRTVEEEDSRLVVFAFDSVPEPLREVLALHAREDRATSRVAALLGLSEARVAVLLDRAHALRFDVLVTFEQIARRTSPDRGFTDRVLYRVREEAARKAKPLPVARRVAMALGLVSSSG